MSRNKWDFFLKPNITNSTYQWFAWNVTIALFPVKEKFFQSFAVICLKLLFLVGLYVNNLAYLFNSLSQ